MIQHTNDLDKIKNIRINIFSKELGLRSDEVFDNDDKRLDQFFISDDKIIVGTFRLRELSDTYKIERMGILSKYRSKGFGTSALDEIKKYSKQMQKSKILLDSIYDVRKFYENSGFITISDVYSKVGIPHVKMIFYL